MFEHSFALTYAGMANFLDRRVTKPLRLGIDSTESRNGQEPSAMATVTHIDIARARRSRRVLFIGNPTRYKEVSHWAMVKQWMVVHGLEPVRKIDGPALCAIVTEDVLDGIGSPQDALTVQHAREQGIPVISVHDSTQIWQATARVRASIARSGGSAHPSPHHQGA